MTAYATQTDLEARYGTDRVLQRLDRDGDGVADAGVLDKAIASASATVDSYIGSRYATPLQAPLDPAITEAVATMAWYLLWGSDATDPMQKDYSRVLKFLRDVSDGRAKIAHAELSGSSASASPQIVAPTPIFSRETLKDF
ncbi:MAG: DUF1320 domain-containing protein [Alphaproteobacteria bacterium]|nr:DUF1320 domain-containing protein [Alphaproteobacteria bacterium]